jgi:TatD DNase family protein
MQFVDTHCHIHDQEFSSTYKKSIETLITEAAEVGVTRFICVGTNAASSEAAVEFARMHQQAYATLALHPHEVSEKSPTLLEEEFEQLKLLLVEDVTRIVAIGECGLDYYYHPEEQVQQDQQVLFRKHLDLALQYDLPLIFHIRNAFDDFFKILDEYAAEGKKIRGVVHSFSAHLDQLHGSLERGLYIGLNGIMTFTRDDNQLAAAKAVPLDRLVLETDAPFLTPKPFRGTMCELQHVVVTANFLCRLRGETIEQVSRATTANAQTLFSL